MANFAQINEQNFVTEIIVIANADCNGGVFPNSEPIGQTFIASIGLTGEWLQTSYKGNFRNIFAGIGDYFDATLGEYGEFVPPNPDQP